MNVMDYIGWALMLGVGVLVGLILSSILAIFSLGLHAMAGVLLLIVFLVIAWEAFTGHLQFRFLDRLFGLNRTEEAKQLERKDRRVSRYAFVLGIVAAFLASLVWPADAIMEEIPWI